MWRVHFQHCVVSGWADDGVRERTAVAVADVRGIEIPAERRERTYRRLAAEEVKDRAGSTLEDDGQILLPIQGGSGYRKSHQHSRAVARR